MVRLTALPQDILQMLVDALEPGHRIHFLHVLGWREQFWHTLYSLSLKDLCHCLGVVGTRQHVSLTSAKYYMNIIRTFFLRCARHDLRNPWATIAQAVDLHPLLLSIIHALTNSERMIYGAATAAKKGHHAILQWMFEHDRSVTQYARDAALSAAISAGDITAVDICLRHDTAFVPTKDTAISILGSKKMDFIKAAMTSIRPPVDGDVMRYAIRRLPLPVISYLAMEYNHLFDAAAMSQVGTNPHLDVIIWLHEHFSRLIGSPQILKIACLDYQAIWTNVSWLMDFGYVFSADDLPREMYNLQVVERVLTEYPDAIAAFVPYTVQVDVNCPLSTLRWLRNHPRLETLAAHVLDSAFMLMNVPLLQRMKEAGFVLQGWQNDAEFWEFPGELSVEVLDYIKSQGARLEDEHAVGPYLCHTLPALRRYMELFPRVVLNHGHLEFAIQKEAIDMLQWMITQHTFDGDSHLLLQATNGRILKCLLTHRNDPINESVLRHAISLHSLTACQLIHAKAPTIATPRSILLEAASHNCIKIARWCLQTFPASFVGPSEGHVTVADIIEAHKIATPNRVSLYLEQQCSALFLEKPATENRALCVLNAERAIDAYMQDFIIEIT